MPGYVVDGLAIETDVVLPGARERAAGDPDWLVEVRRGAVPRDDGPVEWTGKIDGDEGTWARYGLRAGRTLVRIEGTFELSTDRAARTATLLHDRGPAADALLLRRCLPYLAALRGRLVFHAAAVAFPAGAVLFCGEAGTGKSTLATALDARGIPVLADDHVAVDFDRDGRPRVHASVPWIEVATASLAAFRPEEAAHGARRVGYRTERPRSPVPLREITFVTRGDRVSRSQVPASRAFATLLRDVLFVGDPNDASEHGARFDATTRLLATVPVSDLTIPTGLAALAASLAAVEAPWLEAVEGR